jgi:hypothetical protein
VIFTEEGPILRVLGGSSENAMNDIEKFLLIGSRMLVIVLI